MTFKTVTCIEIACDVCGEYLDEQNEGSRQHFTTVADAANGFKPPQEQQHWIDEWIVWPDGYAICNSDDDEHQAARDPLRPVQPAVQVEGQGALPIDTARIGG